MRRTTVLPDERERARVVEVRGPGGCFVEVQLITREAGEHNVVVGQRVGVGVEIADQVERPPVPPHAQVGLLDHEIAKHTFDLGRRIRQ